MATWDNLEKPGIGAWTYNEADLEYNQDTDTETGNDVYYNTLGITSSWTDQTKS